MQGARAHDELRDRGERLRPALSGGDQAGGSSPGWNSA